MLICFCLSSFFQSFIHPIIPPPPPHPFQLPSWVGIWFRTSVSIHMSWSPPPPPERGRGRHRGSNTAQSFLTYFVSQSGWPAFDDVCVWQIFVPGFLVCIRLVSAVQGGKCDWAVFCHRQPPSHFGNPTPPPRRLSSTIHCCQLPSNCQCWMPEVFFGL